MDWGWELPGGGGLKLGRPGGGCAVWSLCVHNEQTQSQGFLRVSLAGIQELTSMQLLCSELFHFILSGKGCQEEAL